MSGADLANLVNEAALLATREDKEAIDSLDFEAARDKILMGAKREDVITEEDKRATAYHESGHALVGWLTPKSDPVHKVTIIPRGRALGLTQYLPEEDRTSYNESQIQARLDSLMGGRAAEKLIYEDLSTGAADGSRDGHPAGAQDGHPVGNERPGRAGVVSVRRREPVPRPRDHRAARPFRAHAADHRRRSGTDPSPGR